MYIYVCICSIRDLLLVVVAVELGAIGRGSDVEAPYDTCVYALFITDKSKV